VKDGREIFDEGKLQLNTKKQKSEDDDLLKIILGELNSDGEASSSATVNIAPRPIKSLRKQATEKEI
jgi:hypothetical protein